MIIKYNISISISITVHIIACGGYFKNIQIYYIYHYHRDLKVDIISNSITIVRLHRLSGYDNNEWVIYD